MKLNGMTILAALCVASACWADGAGTNLAVTAQEVCVRDGIGNFVAKVKSGKTVKIAYFGGSITEMDGWRRLSREWLQSEYPDCRFQEINAAIGGTGSGLGVFRLGQDALRHGPDLVFVEFAVNDVYTSPETIWENFDGIVRQIWRRDPRTDIVFVYTVASKLMPDYEKGVCARAAGAMERIADFYGIPSICFGPRVAAEFKAGRLVMSIGEIETAVPKETPQRDKRINEELKKRGQMLFSKDGIHPTLFGHGLYLESIKAAWRAWKGIGPVDHGKRLARPFRSARYDEAKMVPLSESMCKGEWTRLPAGDPNQSRFGHRAGQIWMAEKPGSRLCFSFKGTECKIYDLLGPDCGQVWITVDGVRKARPFARFDSYCAYYRLMSLHVFSGADGVHTVEIEVDKDQPSRAPVRTRRPNEDLSQKKYDGTKFFPSQIMLVGDIVAAPAKDR